MQVNVTFRRLDSSKALKDYVSQKLGKMDKFFYGFVEANVILSVEKHRHKAEIIIKGDRTTLSSAEEKEDMYEAIDLVVDKIERQVKKYKSKIRERKGTREERSHPLRVGAS